MKNLKLPLSWAAANVGQAKIGAGLAEFMDRPITGISTDSRTIKPGEIFVALAGENFDGHDHAAAALNKGALAALVHKPLPGRPGRRSIIATDTLEALGELARTLRRRQALRVVALTGSNGKTTTKEMLASILRLNDPHLLATAGNFNNLVGLPLTIFRLNSAVRQAILEMGANHFGEIARLTAISEPDVALITSIGPAHLEFFGALERVAQAKGELYAGLKKDAWAIVNADEPLLLRQARRFSGSRLYFGATPRADIRLGRIADISLAGQKLTLYGPGAERGLRIRLKLLGPHNALNAVAAAAAALAAGADWEAIREGLESSAAFPGRLNAFKAGPRLWVLDDSYNANPSSVSAGLETLAGFKRPAARGAILGDMLELGPRSQALHKKIGRLAATLKLDFLGLVGPLSAYAAAAAVKAGLAAGAVREFETPEEAADWVLARLKRPAAALVKGSRAMRMERAVERLRASGAGFSTKSGRGVG